MSLSLIRLNLKLIFSSLMFKCVYIFSLGAFLFFDVVLDISSNGFISGMVKFDSYTYYEVALFILIFCVSMYFAHSSHMMESLCFLDERKITLYKLVATLLATFSLCAIPILFVIKSAIIERASPMFAFISLVYVIMRWVPIIALGDTLGFIVGYYAKSNYAYFISIPASIIFTFQNYHIVSYIPGLSLEWKRKVSAFLSLQKPFVNAMDMDYIGPRLDSFFCIKFICMVAFSILLILLFSIIIKKRLELLPSVFLMCSVGVLLVASYFYFLQFPISYDYSEKLYIQPKSVPANVIVAYSGNISLAEYSTFNCTITVSNADGKQTIGALKMRLDKSLSLKSIICNNQSVEYTRDGDYLIITDNHIAQMRRANIELVYTGRIYYISDINSVNLFTTDIAAALPPNFAFVPLIDGDYAQKTFLFNISSYNTLISNLNTKLVSPHNYIVSGESSSFCIFSGFLSSFEYDGITFYRATYNNRTNYPDVYSHSLTLRHFDSQTYELSSTPISKPKKVFIIYYLYGVLGFPVAFEDYTMINYGYTF